VNRTLDDNDLDLFVDTLVRGFIAKFGLNVRRDEKDACNRNF